MFVIEAVRISYKLAYIFQIRNKNKDEDDDNSEMEEMPDDDDAVNEKLEVINIFQ